MRIQGIIGVSSAFLLWNPACAQVAGEPFPFRQELCSSETRLEPVMTSDIEIFVELIGIPNTAQINAQRLQIRRALGLGNACAIPQAQGFATIAYDPNWAAGDTPGFY